MNKRGVIREASLPQTFSTQIFCYKTCAAFASRGVPAILQGHTIKIYDIDNEHGKMRGKAVHRPGQVRTFVVTGRNERPSSCRVRKDRINKIAYDTRS